MTSLHAERRTMRICILVHPLDSIDHFRERLDLEDAGLGRGVGWCNPITFPSGSTSRNVNPTFGTSSVPMTSFPPAFLNELIDVSISDTWMKFLGTLWAFMLEFTPSSEMGHLGPHFANQSDGSGPFVSCENHSDLYMRRLLNRIWEKKYGEFCYTLYMNPSHQVKVNV